MNLKKQIQDLLIEIAAIEDWIMQLGMCLEMTSDQDPDYITLLLQEAGALEYLEELKKLLEELMKQEQEKQKDSGGQNNDEKDKEEGDQEEPSSPPQIGIVPAESQEEEEDQGQSQEDEEDQNQEPVEGDGHQADWGDEPIEKGDEIYVGDVAPAPRGVNQALWDLIGEANYKSYIKFAPVELQTRVQKATIAGREHNYKIPRPDGKVITRRTLVQRIKYNGEVIKLAYIPEIHTVVWDK